MKKRKYRYKRRLSKHFMSYEQRKEMVLKVGVIFWLVVFTIICLKGCVG